MSRTIKRGDQIRRAAPRRVAAPKPSLGDRLLARLPIGEPALRRIVNGVFLTIGGAAAVAVAVWVGVPAMIAAGVAEGAAAAGFRVEQIEVTGLKRMDRMSVYAVATDQQSLAMTAVDLDAVRERLLRYGWIADAHVSRRLPDTLLIAIEEREPAAVWQDNGQLTLIDRSGVLLEPVDPAALPALPLVIGPGADRQEPAYQALLAAAPALRPRVKAATWIGNRRWDLTFDSGETLALPEDGAASALATFAQMNDRRPLLGRGWIRFDLRDPTKLVARRPGADLAHSVAGTVTPAPIERAPPAAAGTATASTEG